MNDVFKRERLYLTPVHQFSTLVRDLRLWWEPTVARVITPDIKMLVFPYLRRLSDSLEPPPKRDHLKGLLLRQPTVELKSKYSWTRLLGQFCTVRRLGVFYSITNSSTFGKLNTIKQCGILPWLCIKKLHFKWFLYTH